MIKLVLEETEYIYGKVLSGKSITHNLITRISNFIDIRTIKPYKSCGWTFVYTKDNQNKKIALTFETIYELDKKDDTEIIDYIEKNSIFV